jgi:hypothetical protein
MSQMLILEFKFISDNVYLNLIIFTEDNVLRHIRCFSTTKIHPVKKTPQTFQATDTLSI